MPFEDLAIGVLQQISAVAVQHTGLAAGHGGTVPVFHIEAVASSLHAIDLDALVIEERMEQTDGVGAAADAGDERVGQPSFGGLHLFAHLGADHRLEVAHHRRIRMRACRRTDQVVGVVHVGHPVAQRLVHRVLERLRSGRHGVDLGA